LNDVDDSVWVYAHLLELHGLILCSWKALQDPGAVSFLSDGDFTLDKINNILIIAISMLHQILLKPKTHFGVLRDLLLDELTGTYACHTEVLGEALNVLFLAAAWGSNNNDTFHFKSINVRN
jgi:hypothetical protein